MEKFTKIEKVKEIKKGHKYMAMGVLYCTNREEKKNLIKKGEVFTAYYVEKKATLLSSYENEMGIMVTNDQLELMFVEVEIDE